MLRFLSRHLNLGKLSQVKGQTQAVWLDIHGEVWHFCFFSKSFIDELLWEEGVALRAQLTASLRKNTVQREMRNAKPCLQPGNPVHLHLK